MRTHPWRVTPVLTLLMLGTACTGPRADDDEPLRTSRAAVKLADGSTVIGQLDNVQFNLDLGFQKLAIPSHRIYRIDFQSQHPLVARVELINRDRLTGELLHSHLKLKASFGPVKLPSSSIASLTVFLDSLNDRLPSREGLVLYLPFDRDEGTRCTSQTIEEAPLRANVIGARWVEQGVRGGAMLFSGRDRLEVPHTPALNTPTVSFACWVHESEPSSGYQVILAKTQASSWNNGYGLIKNSGDPRNLHFFLNYYSRPFAQASLIPGKWTHVAAVHSEQETVFYVNGIATSRQKADPGKQPPVRINFGNDPLYIGGDTSHYGWKGMIDEVIIYDRALSDDEVWQLFRGTVRSIHGTGRPADKHSLRPPAPKPPSTRGWNTTAG